MNFFNDNKATEYTSESVFRRIKHFSILSLMLVPVIISGCQKGSEQLPPNSSVVVNPSEITWEIGNTGGVCNFNPDFYQDHTISIMVLNESGNYIPDAPLTVSVDLSGNTFSGVPALALYDDKNGSMIPIRTRLPGINTSFSESICPVLIVECFMRFQTDIWARLQLR